MFYIIRELGASTFQITNNLKFLSTGGLMYVFLDRKLTRRQWAALLLLSVGSAVTQLNPRMFESTNPGVGDARLGCVLVFVNALAAGTGSVFSERLLKGIGSSPKAMPQSIHWQNMQLYLFGIIFGVLAIQLRATPTRGASILLNLFHGYNMFAYATVASLAACGILVSFILKYLDNVAKCFVAAASMLIVALLDSAIKQRSVPINVACGILLTCIALMNYHIG